MIDDDDDQYSDKEGSCYWTILSSLLTLVNLDDMLDMWQKCVSV